MEHATFEGLLKDEVVYELSLRGIEFDITASAATLLRLLEDNPMPANTQTEDAFIATLDVAKEIQVCTEKLANLKSSKISTSLQRQKCHARLAHLINRLNKIRVQSNDHIALKFSLLQDIIALNFNITLTPAPSRETSPSRLLPSASNDEATRIPRVLQENGGDGKVLTTTEEATYSLPIPTYPTNSSYSNTYPLSRNSAMLKWGIKYDGHTCVLEFIRQIQEFSSSCSASDAEILNNFSHLLTGDALIWFRSYSNNITSLSQLFSELKQEFLPVDYDRRLLLQIKGRLQEKSEDIKCYINLMLHEMSKLSYPLPESEKLNIISSNMNPFYIAKLALHDFSTVAELKSVCAKLDIAKYRCESRGALNSGNIALVPGFTVNQSSKSFNPQTFKHKSNQGNINTVSHSQTSSQHNNNTCLKCGGTHHYSDCNVYNTPICFKCKKPNVLTRNCPCSKN